MSTYGETPINTIIDALKEGGPSALIHEMKESGNVNYVNLSVKLADGRKVPLAFTYSALRKSTGHAPLVLQNGIRSMMEPKAFDPKISFNARDSPAFTELLELVQGALTARLHTELGVKKKAEPSWPLKHEYGDSNKVPEEKRGQPRANPVIQVAVNPLSRMEYAALVEKRDGKANQTKDNAYNRRKTTRFLDFNAPKTANIPGSAPITTWCDAVAQDELCTEPVDFDAEEVSAVRASLERDRIALDETLKPELLTAHIKKLGFTDMLPNSYKLYYQMVGAKPKVPIYEGNADTWVTTGSKIHKGTFEISASKSNLAAFACKLSASRILLESAGPYNAEASFGETLSDGEPETEPESGIDQDF